MTDPRLQRVLFIPDCHIPYHDVRAFECMLKAAHEFKPDKVVLLGDFLDCYSVSDFSKDPARGYKFKDELNAGSAALSNLGDLGAKEKIYIFGNHEDRLDRFIADKAPQLHGLVSIENSLALKARGWKTISYKDHFKLGELFITHDTGRSGRYAIYQSMADFGDNVIIGHTHRLSYVVEGTARGTAHVGASFGWLGDFNKVNYMHTIRAKRDWAHGFGIGYMEPGTGVVHVQPVPIVNGKCVLEGKLVRS